MATTNLIVDFLVIGITSVIWLTPILLYFFNTPWLSVLHTLGVAHVPLLLGGLYAVGIPVSRLADAATGTYNDDVRDGVFGADSTSKYHNQLNRIVAICASGSEYLGYRRSIVRVSRGCALNAYSGALAWSLLAWLKPGFMTTGSHILIIVACLGVFVAMLRAWRVVLEGYFHSVKDIHCWLSEKEYWARRNQTC